MKSPDDGVGTNAVYDKNVSALISGDGSTPVENSAISLPEVKVKEEISECETLRCHDDSTNVDGGVNADTDARQANGVVGKGRRGRKRKNAEASGCDQKKVDKVVLDGVAQVNGRVLRSRTMASANGGNDVFKESVDVEREKEVVGVDKKKIKVERVVDGSVQPSRRGRKKKKGRRGRPPNMNSEKEASAFVVSKTLHMKIGSSKVVNGKREEVFKQKENHKKLKAEVTFEESKSSEQCKSKGLSPDPNNSGMKKDVQTSERNEESGIARMEEKQLVREQLIEILKKAGWTIEYRPRNGRVYNDMVYVEANGRTHWSVTKAYRRLQEKVDSKIADDQEVAAFTVVPEEVLSKLFRIIEKKRKDFGTKKRKGVTEKEIPKNESSSKTLVDSKRKRKLNSCPKSHAGKPRSNPQEVRNKKRYALLARSSGNGPDSDGEAFVLYDGKRSLLSWMIDLGTVPKCGKVQYMNSRRTRVLCEGKITGDGICCICCNVIHTLLSFESHAGSKLGEPFKNIYLTSGPSLLQCLVDSWNKFGKIDNIRFCFMDVAGDDPNDDTCNICGDGGDLICCDGCPSTFHQSCLDIQNFPAGDWRCVYCSCKFCGTVGGNTSQGVDDHDTVVTNLFTCQLCEEKFHIPCVEGKDAMYIDFKSPFCGKGCQKLFKRLHELLGVRHELEEGFSWTILQHRDVGTDVSHSDDPLKIECNSKLAVAFSVMDECFLPIVDQRSKTNMIHNVVYSCGSNFRRLNYKGFYTIILERGDEVISAASIRIHGNQLAEMPFIATRYIYRRQGMCRRLLTAIETALCSLEVAKLVIPAISELMETWTKVFGFMPLEESKRQEMRHMSMIVFPGTDMLQKPLQKYQLTSGQMTSGAGSECSELVSESKSQTEDQIMDELPSKYAMNCFSGADSNASSDVILGKNGETDAVRSGDSLADGSLNDVSDITNGAIISNEPSCDEECVNLKASSIDSKYIIASETSAVDGPSLDVQKTEDEMKICPSARFGSIAVHPDEKIVNGTSKLNQQDSCLDETESTLTQVKPFTGDHVEKTISVSETVKELLIMHIMKNVNI